MDRALKKRKKVRENLATRHHIDQFILLNIYFACLCIIVLSCLLQHILKTATCRNYSAVSIVAASKIFLCAPLFGPVFLLIELLLLLILLQLLLQLFLQSYTLARCCCKISMNTSASIEHIVHNASISKIFNNFHYFIHKPVKYSTLGLLKY